MRRTALFFLLSVAASSSDACIHHHKEWPPRNTHKIISFSTEKRIAIAAFVRHALVRFPEIRVACLSLENEEDAPYAYDPDAALLKAIKVPQQLVASRDCPPTYDPDVSMPGYTSPKPPAGYVNPWGVFVRDFELYGKHQAQAVVEVRQRGLTYVHSCNATRIGRHNWRVNCPYNSFQLLSGLMTNQTIRTDTPTFAASLTRPQRKRRR